MRFSGNMPDREPRCFTEAEPMMPVKSDLFFGNFASLREAGIVIPQKLPAQKTPAEAGEEAGGREKAGKG